MAQETVVWFSWDEGIAKSKDENKKVIIDLYTDWCGWCKKMDNTTFRDPYIVEIINEHFVAIKFNAEHREDIEFHDEIYKFTKGGRRGYHGLAAKMTKGKLRYPTIAFLNEDNEFIQAIPGFQNTVTLEKILMYFAHDNHKTTPWSSFQRNYKSKTQITPSEKKSNHTRLVSGGVN